MRISFYILSLLALANIIGDDIAILPGLCIQLLVIFFFIFFVECLEDWRILLDCFPFLLLFLFISCVYCVDFFRLYLLSFYVLSIISWDRDPVAPLGYERVRRRFLGAQSWSGTRSIHVPVCRYCQYRRVHPDWFRCYSRGSPTQHYCETESHHSTICSGVVSIDEQSFWEEYPDYCVYSSFLTFCPTCFLYFCYNDYHTTGERWRCTQS